MFPGYLTCYLQILSTFDDSTESKESHIEFGASDALAIFLLFTTVENKITEFYRVLRSVETAAPLLSAAAPHVATMALVFISLPLRWSNM